MRSCYHHNTCCCSCPMLFLVFMHLLPLVRLLLCVPLMDQSMSLLMFGFGSRSCFWSICNPQVLFSGRAAQCNDPALVASLGDASVTLVYSCAWPCYWFCPCCHAQLPCLENLSFQDAFLKYSERWFLFYRQRCVVVRGQTMKGCCEMECGQKGNDRNEA